MYRTLVLTAIATVLGMTTANLHAQVVPAGRDFSLPRAEVSFAYSLTESNAPPGDCGCFFANGASAEGNFRLYRAYTAVADVTYVHAGNLHNTGVPLSMLMGTGGVRLNFRFGHQRSDGWDTYYKVKPFVQGLVGMAHGFNGSFPQSNGFITDSANSFALLAGVGLDIKWRRHLSFRAIQADYGYTRLPNAAGNDQNLLRISSGITIHIK